MTQLVCEEYVKYRAVGHKIELLCHDVDVCGVAAKTQLAEELEL